MFTRPVGMLFATLALVLAAACGGDDKGGGVLSGGGSANWDASKAEDLTHAALLTAADLGGSGWVADDDSFDDDAMTDASCADYDSFKKDARAAGVARAKRALEKAGTNDFGTQVESTVQVFKDSKTAADFAGRYRGLVGNDKFITCFEADLKESTDRNAKVTIKRLSPTANPPAGGAAAALDVDVSLGRDQLLARTENYVWQSGNAIIQVSVTATKSSFNADVVKTAVSKQEQAANDAVKGSRQRVTEQQAGSTSSSATTPTPQRGSATPTPQRGAMAPTIGSIGPLANTNSHRYAIKIESSGIDFYGMEDLAKTVATLGSGPAPRAGAPITVEMSGSYSKPDKGQVKFTIAGTVMEMTTIGTQQWIKLGNNALPVRTVGRQDVEDLSVAVAVMAGLEDNDDILDYLKCGGNENVNGVAAKKCGFGQGELSRLELQEFVNGFVEESDATVTVRAEDVTRATFQIWVATQGDYPVKLLFEFAGKDTKGTAFNLRMEANVTDINRPVDIAAPR